MTTLDYQIAAGTDDVMFLSNGEFIDDDVVGWGYIEEDDIQICCALRFPSVVIPDDATITSAYIRLCAEVDDFPAVGDIYAEDSANPAAIVSETDGYSRTLTSSSIQITGSADYGAYNSDSIIDILSELMLNYSYSVAAPIQLLIFGRVIESGTEISTINTYETYEEPYSLPAILHIEYTEAASGNPFYAYAQQ